MIIHLGFFYHQRINILFYKKQKNIKKYKIYKNLFERVEMRSI